MTPVKESFDPKGVLTHRLRITVLEKQNQQWRVRVYVCNEYIGLCSIVCQLDIAYLHAEEAEDWGTAHSESSSSPTLVLRAWRISREPRVFSPIWKPEET